ncbi:MAG: AraC family transcriptional regulator [Planctomycetota bacterium]
MPEAEIERYAGADALIPAVPMLGLSHQTTARRALGEHEHGGYEICLLADGAVDWHVAGRAYRIDRPSVFLTRPGERHGAVGGVLQPCRLAWFQIDCDWARRRGWARALDEVDKSCWPAAAELWEYHARLLEHHRLPRPSSPRCVEAWVDLLIDAALRLAEEGADPPMGSGVVRRVAEVIDAEPEHPWSLGELCELAGVGRSRLNELFRASVGRSARAFAAQRRVRRADALLRTTDVSITAIAHRLGYASSQHFASVYRQHFGESPSSARRRAAAGL